MSIREIYEYMFYKISLIYKRLANFTLDDFDKESSNFSAACAVSLTIWVNILTVLVGGYKLFSFELNLSDNVIIFSSLGLLLLLMVVLPKFIFTKQKLIQLTEKWRFEAKIQKIVRGAACIVYLLMSYYLAYKVIIGAIFK